MRSAKYFFLLMLALVIGILFFDWVRNTYFPGDLISPVARIKTIFIIIFGAAIMKFSTTQKGFKLFIIFYLGLWAIYYVMNFLALHVAGVEKGGQIMSFYKDHVQLETPLPFVFFWFIDRLFFVENALLSKRQ